MSNDEYEEKFDVEPPADKACKGRPKGSKDKKKRKTPSLSRVEYVKLQYDRAEYNKMKTLDLVETSIRKIYRDLLIGQRLAAPLLDDDGEVAIVPSNTLIDRALLDSLTLPQLYGLDFPKELAHRIEEATAPLWRRYYNAMNRNPKKDWYLG